MSASTRTELMKQLEDSYLSKTARAAFISATEAASLVREAAIVYGKALDARDHAVRLVGAQKLPELLRAAQTTRESLLRLHVMAEFVDKYRLDPAAARMNEAVSAMQRGCNDCHNIVKAQWARAVEVEAGLA